MDCLVPYSASESSDSEEEKLPFAMLTSNPSKKSKLQLLPSAKDKLGERLRTSDDDNATHTSNPEKHQNRVRSFKHERGNWATFVYVPVDESIFDEIPELCIQELAPFVELFICEDFHITLSKTVVLQYHLIDNFVEALKRSIISTCFTVFLGQLEVYINAEKTRTFIGFKLEATSKLLDLLKKVDTTMLDFKLSTFYKKPSFHISFAWCLGNKLDVINGELKRITNDIEKHYQNGLLKSLTIKELRCKIGHKVYTFKLS